MAILARTLCLAALLSVLQASNPSPAMQTDTETSNKERVRAAFQAWADGSGGPFSLLADDARWTIVGGSLAARAYPDKTTFMDEVIHPFNARMATPLRPTVRKLVAQGDTVVVFFDAQGTALDGKPYLNTYAWIMELRGGKAVRVWAFFDAIAFNDLWTRVRPAPAGRTP